MLGRCGDGDHFGVRRRIVEPLALVITTSDDLKVVHDNRPDWHLAILGREIGQPQGLPHEDLVQDVLRHSRVGDLAHFIAPKAFRVQGDCIRWHLMACYRLQTRATRYQFLWKDVEVAMIVTIDGPAGSGKSTVAQRLAERLGVAYLDTGAMYRAVALKALRNQIDLGDVDALAELARTTQIHFVPDAKAQRVLVDGLDVTDDIRTMQVNEATPSVAKVGQVRKTLVDMQRRLGEQLGSLVAEGRDQGSVVFPGANVKFVLDGQVAKRAQRRYSEMAVAHQAVSYQEVLANLTQRDLADQKHWLGLVESHQAVLVDTTDMVIDQVVEHLFHEVQKRKGI